MTNQAAQPNQFVEVPTYYWERLQRLSAAMPFCLLCDGRHDQHEADCPFKDAADTVVEERAS